MQARLVVVGGDVKASEIKLRLPCTIGRGRGSSIVLAHPLVSRQHCEIIEVDGKLQVRDLGSLNGTFVNNQRIAEVAPLPPNELLTVGTVTFRAVYESTPGEPAEEAGEVEKTSDTVYANRGVAGGSGTIPFSVQSDVAGTQPAESQPASQSSMEANPPDGQLAGSAAGPSDEPANAVSSEEPGPQDEDDDLQDFLRTLEK